MTACNFCSIVQTYGHLLPPICVTPGRLSEMRYGGCPLPLSKQEPTSMRFRQVPRSISASSRSTAETYYVAARHPHIQMKRKTNALLQRLGWSTSKRCRLTGPPQSCSTCVHFL